MCCVWCILFVYGSYDCCRNSVSMCVWNYFLSILRHVRHPRSIIDSIRDQTESFEILKQALALQYAHASLSPPLSPSLCVLSLTFPINRTVTEFEEFKQKRHLENVKLMERGIAQSKLVVFRFEGTKQTAKEKLLFKVYSLAPQIEPQLIAFGQPVDTKLMVPVRCKAAGSPFLSPLPPPPFTVTATTTGLSRWWLILVISAWIFCRSISW